ncbi:MAG: hypothetical protein ABIH72_04445, partial [archaeon]
VALGTAGLILGCSPNQANSQPSPQSSPSSSQAPVLEERVETNHSIDVTKMKIDLDSIEIDSRKYNQNNGFEILDIDTSRKLVLLSLAIISYDFDNPEIISLPKVFEGMNFSVPLKFLPGEDILVYTPQEKGLFRVNTNTAERKLIAECMDGWDSTWFVYPELLTKKDGNLLFKGQALDIPYFVSAKVSPDKEKILFIDRGENVFVYNSRSGQRIQLKEEVYALGLPPTIDSKIARMQWSADSNLVAYTCISKNSGQECFAIRAYDINTHQKATLFELSLDEAEGMAEKRILPASPPVILSEREAIGTGVSKKIQGVSLIKYNLIR